MQVCSRCLYGSNHPLHITFDERGICSGCQIHEEKDKLDWSERGEKLRLILDGYKNKSGSNYDCIVPVSGARDSFFIVDVLKNTYGMNPLLVTYNKQWNTAVGMRNLSNLRIKLNCDLMMLTINPATVKKITRSTFRKFGSIYWHCIAGQTAYPVQVAVKFKIPLIIWGVHQGVDQVGMFSHLDEVEMTRKYRKEHDLMGYEAEDLVSDFDLIQDDDILPYKYPDNREIEQVGVRGIYLSNFIRWDSRSQHEKMIEKYGYETAAQCRTFDSYNDVDCWNYSDVHDYMKYLKHGYGKVIDHATREIRLGKMTRSDGVLLAEKFMNTTPKNLDLFLKWLGITENSFNYLADQHRNPLFWKRDIDWNWVEVRKNSILERSRGNESELIKSNLTVFDDFVLTSAGDSTDPDGEYILIGRGY